MDNGTLKLRLATGLPLVIIISGALLSGPMPAVVLLLCINALGMHEYLRLMKPGGFSPSIINTHLAGIAIIAASWIAIVHNSGSAMPLLSLLLAPALLIAELFRKRKTPFENVALTLLGIVWISLPLGLFIRLGYMAGEKSYHPSLLLGYFVILWLGDGGAYLVGKLAGRHKLFYRISPNKTWEGSAGGFFFALLAGFMNFRLLHVLELEEWLILSIIINITGSFGDLIKSMLKRSVGVKDTGTILPGHGGILDRFDSLLGSVPFSFVYLTFYA